MAGAKASQTLSKHALLTIMSAPSRATNRIREAEQEEQHYRASGDGQMQREQRLKRFCALT